MTTPVESVAGPDGVVRRGKRFGWPTLVVVTIAALWAGGAIRNAMAKSYQADLLATFPSFLEINSPVSIQMDWNATETEIDGTSMFRQYSGPATYLIRNQSDRPIKMVFPPQNGFRFEVRDTGASMSPRTSKDIPAWARRNFVLELTPGEEHRFEEDYTIASSPISEKRCYGPVGLDFAAPSGADVTGYVTGTVVCKMKAKVTKSRQTH
ncbi:hypothetical protein Pan44_49130 [Caulifigura coniformis]|uniref:Uncharacterized protein n=1 Tax=Caulifigura coniformis TaxID=2527983 RepID=A0A517SL51_9PLAN|nr:hypothetical protein [Caulifigura coniformis]QDT56853.1 hypothetical protein Pan44_49130 [Caulifigura coniformis]